MLPRPLPSRDALIELFDRELNEVAAREVFVGLAELLLTTDDMRLASRLAVAGGGIVLLPLITAEALVTAGRLVRVLPKLSMPDVSLRIISPNQSLEPLAVRLFREGLLAELNQRPAARVGRKN